MTPHGIHPGAPCMMQSRTEGVFRREWNLFRIVDYLVFFHVQCYDVHFLQRNAMTAAAAAFVVSLQAQLPLSPPSPDQSP
eukprot:4141397-Ditylum_brightwellii.AAC.2